MKALTNSMFLNFKIPETFSSILNPERNVISFKNDFIKKTLTRFSTRGHGDAGARSEKIKNILFFSPCPRVENGL